MLSLVSGHYPADPGQVAVTGGVASAFHLKVGDGWHQGGRTRTVTGIVENPQSLLDEFALVVPGQVSAPTQVSVLFDAPGASPHSLGPNVQTASAAVPRQHAQSREHLDRRAHGRDAPHRPGGRGRLHRAGAAPAALARDAGLAGRHGLARPSGRPGQRRHRRRHRRGHRGRGGPGGLARLPAAARDERPPRDRRVQPALAGDRAGAGPGRGGRVRGRVAAGPGRSPGSPS